MREGEEEEEHERWEDEEEEKEKKRGARSEEREGRRQVIVLSPAGWSRLLPRVRYYLLPLRPIFPLLPVVPWYSNRFTCSAPSAGNLRLEGHGHLHREPAKRVIVPRRGNPGTRF